MPIFFLLLQFATNAILSQLEGLIDGPLSELVSPNISTMIIALEFESPNILIDIICSRLESPNIARVIVPSEIETSKVAIMMIRSELEKFNVAMNIFLLLELESITNAITVVPSQLESPSIK